MSEWSTNIWITVQWRREGEIVVLEKFYTKERAEAEAERMGCAIVVESGARPPYYPISSDKKRRKHE